MPDGSADETDSHVPILRTHCARAHDWPILCTKRGNLFRQDYGWSAEVAKIKMPVLLVFGYANAVRVAAPCNFSNCSVEGHGMGDGSGDVLQLR